MNLLEQKCNALAYTPQSKWFDLRFKPFIQLLNNMMSKGEIKGIVTIPNHVFNMLHIQVMSFKYSEQYYLLFINQVGNVYESFHVETPDSNYMTYSNTVKGEIILSSDDDPKQEIYINAFTMTLGVKSNQELVSKLKTYLGE